MTEGDPKGVLPRLLTRELGVFGAMMMGLGSIVGTGIFVSIGIAAGVAGPSVVLAISLAALVAVCNGLSSAEIALGWVVDGFAGTLALPMGGRRLCAESRGLLRTSVRKWSVVLPTDSSGLWRL